MRKKIIFLAVCAVLLLIFMSSSYGGPDPKYVRLMADPWDRMLSPKSDDNNLDVILLAFNPDYCFMFTFKSKVKDFKELTNQKSISTIKRYSSNKNGTSTKK
jgi:hypothetical protein